MPSFIGLKNQLLNIKDINYVFLVITIIPVKVLPFEVKKMLFLELKAIFIRVFSILRIIHITLLD